MGDEEGEVQVERILFTGMVFFLGRTSSSSGALEGDSSEDILLYAYWPIRKPVGERNG